MKQISSKTIVLLFTVMIVFSAIPILGSFLACFILAVLTLAANFRVGLLSLVAVTTVSVAATYGWQVSHLGQISFLTSVLLEKISVFLPVFLIASYFKHSQALVKTMQLTLLVVCTYFVLLAVTGNSIDGQAVSSYMNCLLGCGREAGEQPAMTITSSAVNQFVLFWAPAKVFVNILYLLIAQYILNWRQRPGQFIAEIKALKLSRQTGIALYLLALTAIFAESSDLIASCGYSALLLLSLFGVAHLMSIWQARGWHRYWLWAATCSVFLNIKVGLLGFASVALIRSLSENWLKFKQAND